MAKLARAADTGDDELQLWDWRYYDTQLRKHRVRRRPPRGRRLLPARAGARRDARDHRRGVRARVPSRSTTRRCGTPTSARFAIVDLAPAARTSPSSTWTCSPARASTATPPRSTSCPAAGWPTARTGTPVSAIVANFTKPTAERPVAAPARRGRHAVPRVRPHPPPDPDAGRDGPVLRDAAPSATSSRRRRRSWSTGAGGPRSCSRFARHHETGEPIPDRARRAARRGPQPQRRSCRRCARCSSACSTWASTGPPPEDGRRRRRARPRRHPAPGRGGRSSAPRRRDVHAGQLRAPARRLRRRVLRLPVVEGVRRRHVQPVRRRRRHRTRRSVGPYRTAILEKGGSVAGDEMLEEFLGRPPSNEAFLAELGIGVMDADAAGRPAGDRAARPDRPRADDDRPRPRPRAVRPGRRPPASPRCACGRRSSSRAPARLAGTGVRVATVVNFPAGTDPADGVGRGDRRGARRRRRRDRRRAAVPGVAGRRHAGAPSTCSTRRAQRDRRRGR